MKKLIVAAFAAVLALCLAGCAGGNTPSSDKASDVIHTDANKHVIGVAVYDITDQEVIMMRQYLQEYVAGQCFDDVQFVCSETISSEEDMQEFIKQVANLGGEGILSKISIDLEAEVKACEENKMYYEIISGTKTAQELAVVQDNPYFLGIFGPGSVAEIQAGRDMAQFFVDQKKGNSYFIMTGGADMNNAAHIERAQGMMETLSKAYNANLDAASLARSTEPVTLTVGELTLTVAPGYPGMPDKAAKIVETYKAGKYDYILSTLSLAPVVDDVIAGGSAIGMVDCYSQENQLLFSKGMLQYVTGKYGSLIGPSFAAMYNAVTGHANVVRDNGKAFQVTQGFWTSVSDADYEEKYTLSSNPTIQAYDYDDLKSMCAESNPNVTFNDIKKLAEAYSFEDVKARRGL